MDGTPEVVGRVDGLMPVQRIVGGVEVERDLLGRRGMRLQEAFDKQRSIAAPSDWRPPCPCYGGRMIIVETFQRGNEPRYSARGHSAVTTTPTACASCRSIMLPVADQTRAAAAVQRIHVVDQTKATASNPAVPTCQAPLRSSIGRHLTVKSP